ncbi:MAG TPA: O-antigen ligase family protein [Vicinamibacterales bacterium]
MLRSLFIFLILVPGLAMAIRNRYAGLLLYVWFALFRPQEWLWVDVAFLRLSLVIGLLLVVPALLTGVFPTIKHPLAIGMATFVGFSIVAQFVAVDAELAFVWLDYLVRLVIVCLFAVTLTTTIRRFVLLMTVMAVSIGFHGAKAGFASLIFGGIQFFDGLAGSFVDSNGYALACAMVIPLLIASGQNLHWLRATVTETMPRHWMRVFFYAAAPLCAFTIVSLFSRGGFLALMASIVVLVLVQRRRLLATVGLAAVATAALTVAPLPKGYADRLSTIRTYEEVNETSALSRIHFWRVAVDMAMDRPLGVGLRNFEEAYDQYDFSGGEYGTRRAVHNSHLQVLAETGFGGAVTYVGLFLASLWILLQVRSRARRVEPPTQESKFLFSTANALIVSTVAYLVGATFVSMPFNDLTWLTFALVASLHRLAAELCPVSKPVIQRVPSYIAPAIGRANVA